MKPDKKARRRKRPDPPQPLVLPKHFPECRVCGETRVFCAEAMKGDAPLNLESLGKTPALFSYEYAYDTALYPVRLIAIGDICVECGTPRTIVMDKLKGKPRILKGDGGPAGGLMLPRGG